MDNVVFNRKVTVRPTHLKAGGTDKSRFAEEDAMESASILAELDDNLFISQLERVDPSILAEVLEYLEQNQKAK